MKRNGSAGFAIGALLICMACSAGAQMVRLVSPSRKQFTDSEYGVTFTFPASWAFSNEHRFMFPPLITDFRGDGEKPTELGSVSSRVIPGIAAGETDFVGAEFTVAARRNLSPTACMSLASVITGGEPVENEIVQGHTMRHSRSTSVGTGHGVTDDVYVLPDHGSCLLFDLALHFADVGDAPGRRFAHREEQQIHAQLLRILNSVTVL